MLLVFLSHFVEALYYHLPDSSSQTIRLVTRVATPAFAWISGVTLAVLFARHQRSFAHTRDRLIDRGLFLILVGHPLSVLACVPLYRSWHAAERIVFITDTLGAAVIVGSWLISRVRPGRRFLLGIGVLMAAWGGLAAWNPPIASMAWRIKDYLLGDWRDSWLTYNFPLVPWFGFYLVASAAGTTFAKVMEDERRRKVLPFQTALLGVGAMGAALVLKAGLHSLAGLAPLSSWGLAIDRLGSVTAKLPPSPGYMLFYGGFALLIFAGLQVAQRVPVGQAFARWVSLFGRYSLAAFIFQYYVYYVGVSLLPRRPGILSPLYFLVTVLVLWMLVSLWDRLGANRLVTVGYPAMVAHWNHRFVQPAPGGFGLSPHAKAATPGVYGPPPPQQ